MKYQMLVCLMVAGAIGCACAEVDDSCQPICNGRECGPDGCGGVCGQCSDFGTQCVNGGCQTISCTPDCEGKNCGDDGCGGSCGTCWNGMICQNSSGICTNECKPNCDEKQCGDDGCGGTCGSCSNGYVCRNGVCSNPSECIADCTDKVCGDDGCGSSCGTCSNGFLCYSGICDSCRASCANRECGSDGCGNSCGTCGAQSSCNESNGKCMPFRVKGRLLIETQTVFFDITTSPRLDKKLDINGSRIPISLRDNSGNELAQTTTASDGTFEMTLSRLPIASDWLSIVPVWNVADKPKVAIFKQNADESRELWEWTIRLSNYTIPDDPGDLGDIRITTELFSGALYLYQLIVRAYDDLIRYGFSYDLNKLPSMGIIWTPELSWSCGSCYIRDKLYVGKMSFDSAMFVGGASTDESAWGYPTILHEFGHFVLFQKRDDTTGGIHYLTGISHPTLAWSEGWATFFSLEMMSLRNNAPVTQYWRVLQNGSYWLDYAHLYDGALGGNIYVPQPDISSGIYQNIAEGWITYMLWDFWDGSEVKDPVQPSDGIAFSAKQIFSAISSQRYLKSESYFSAERCPSEPTEQLECRNTVHFVHFIDALLCSSDASVVTDVSNLLIERNYPYDRSPICEVQP